MPPQLSEHVVVNLLRPSYTAPQCQASRLRQQRLQKRCSRALSTIGPQPRPRHRLGSRSSTPACASSALLAHPGTTSPNPGSSPVAARAVGFATAHSLPGRQAEPPRIAVLGGGITGLASAHFLTRESPTAKITLYEASERLGGWLQSQLLHVGDETVLFESGPRTLRPHTPAGYATIEMIQELGLEKEMLITRNDSVAHANRFVYYPDHLVKMPGPGQDVPDLVWRILTEPVFKGLCWGALTEWFRDNRLKKLDDESVGSFLARRLGSEDPGDNLVSAVLHGIYAGDIYQLSMKSLMPMVWHMEGLEDTLTDANFRYGRQGLKLVSKSDVSLHNEVFPKINVSIADALRGASVYSFKGGIGSLSVALEKSLRANPNVEFKLEAGVTSVEYDGESDGVKIQTSTTQPPTIYTKAISTLSSRTLSTLTSAALPTLAQSPSVTVMVVNLYYTSPHILPAHGFGYLIPRSIPFEQNPEYALGVVFDSDAVQGQDTAAGTKVTVMLGGHWWDSFSAYPDEEEATHMARAVLHRHLQITDRPAAVRVSLQKDCIPQYTVGHDKRMSVAHHDLMRAFRGKLGVAGNSYSGVGLNDCVRAARQLVLGMKRGDVVTGLEDFGRKDLWVKVSTSESGWNAEESR
ncbi:protoporphyrinogen oxidase [Diplocarpon rosae]|nr:protoporphyrinogen oxidase [Diplocarpon rosae]